MNCFSVLSVNIKKIIMEASQAIKYTTCICLLIVLASVNMGYAQGDYKRNDIKPIDSTFFVKGRFNDKVIIVTGGARGIGRATALRLSKEGAAIVIADWLPIEGERTAEEIRKEGGKAIFVKTNISDTKECENMVQQAIKAYGKISGAVLNAGVMDGVYSGDKFDYNTQAKLLPAKIHAATDEYWDNVFAVNATGTFKSMRSVLDQLLKQGNGGAIVTVGSIAGLTGLAGNPAYVASKYAVNGLTRNAAIDYAPYGIRVNSVNMAATSTPMVERAMEFVTADVKRGIKGMAGPKTQSLLKLYDSNHRDATPWEQASGICFLLSDEASNLTGANFATDGGWTAY
jgi:NAD(P)-dependent dehydrogenase (short-subunit alcohol dehydrogenase family)